MSFLGNYLKSSKGNRMHLLMTKTLNFEAVWYYILVNKGRVEDFRSDVKEQASMDIADYGKIVKSGWGEEPPQEIRQEMKKEFNFSS